MHVTARADYAVRAALELARSHPEPVKGDRIAEAQDTPTTFTERILADLRRAGLVASRRGGDGGYRLTVEPDRISVADVVRAVEGQMADVRGIPPDALDYPESAVALQRTWIALRANLRSVLESVTLADLASGALPDHVEALAADPDAWRRRVGPQPSSSDPAT
ncbi:MAG: RrF2 family transcriptional regulator [Acidimicrobiales bacterium]